MTRRVRDAGVRTVGAAQRVALPPAAQSIAARLDDEGWRPTAEELAAARCACDTPRCTPQQCVLDLPAPNNR